MTTTFKVDGIADMLGLAEMDGLTEGDWDNVGKEVGIFIRVDDGITKALAGEILLNDDTRDTIDTDGFFDDCIDSEGEEVGVNSAGRQSPPSNPHSYELYGRYSLQYPFPIRSGSDTKQF